MYQREMMMADVGVNLRAFDVFEPRRGRIVKAMRALMSIRRSRPAHTECACAPCQVH